MASVQKALVSLVAYTGGRGTGAHSWPHSWGLRVTGTGSSGPAPTQVPVEDLREGERLSNRRRYGVLWSSWLGTKEVTSVALCCSCLESQPKAPTSDQVGGITWTPVRQGRRSMWLWRKIHYKGHEGEKQNVCQIMYWSSSEAVW